MDKEFMQKLNTLLSRAEYAKLSKAASNAAALDAKLTAQLALTRQMRTVRSIDEAMEEIKKVIRQTGDEETAEKCSFMVMDFIKSESTTTCLSAVEVAQIVVPAVCRLIMRGIVPEYAVKMGLQNAGKHIYEAHCEKMTKHFFG